MKPETAGERIVREMSEEWSSYSEVMAEYGLDVWGDDWREFWKELQAKIDAALVREAEETR